MTASPCLDEKYENIASYRLLVLPPAWKPYFTADTWYAERHSERGAFLVYVSDQGDPLPDAVAQLLPDRPQDWSITFAGMTPDGYTVYVFEHTPAPLPFRRRPPCAYSL